MAQKVVFYWNKTKAETPESFLNFLIRFRGPYFEAIGDFADVYAIFGSGCYLGKMEFQGGYKFQDGRFLDNKEDIRADIVVDRTLGFGFPTEDKDLEGKVINSYRFKRMAGDKYEFARYLPEYAPKTTLISSRGGLEKALSPLSGEDLMVLKPKTGHKGIGVLVGSKAELLKAEIKYPILLQEFIETGGGFNGHSERHDIRLVILNGKIVHSFARLATSDPYRANISQGGSYIELSYNEIPELVKQTAEKVAEKIKKEFDNPFYSMDFGITKDRVIIFEFNSKIGLPESDKKNFPIFKEEFLRTIKEKLR